MPRFAKNSLEQQIYDDLLLAEGGIDPVDLANATRTNSAISRAHRIEQGLAGVATIDRIRAVKNMCRTHDMGWVSDDNFITICSNILKGE